jgi:hypothetical protein
MFKLDNICVQFPLDEQWRIVAYLDGLQAKVNALRELQSQTQEELDALLPSVLRPTGGRLREICKL